MNCIEGPPPPVNVNDILTNSQCVNQSMLGQQKRIIIIRLYSCFYFFNKPTSPKVKIEDKTDKIITDSV